MDATPAESPQPDALLSAIAEHVVDHTVLDDQAYETAALCLGDSLGCALLALGYPACARLLGPVVPGANLPGGARVPGTAYQLDPVQAAFDIGAAIRWLDYNDTFLAAEWGHPSDNFGAILAVADYLDRGGHRALTVHDVLTAAIKAYEIQGVLALGNSFNRVGLDHVLLVRVASAAVVTQMLGGSRQQVLGAISHAWADGGALRLYRHAPNTGARKSWAAGDAASRAVRLALLVLRGESGYPSVLTAQTWGFQDALFRGQKIELAHPLGSYVMANVLFKIAFPAEFHAQTAVEAAISLHPRVQHRVGDIEGVVIHTQQAGKRIIDKTGPLRNPADRDHCLQYMTAVGLLKGSLSADDYEDGAAADPRIDALRAKMQVVEEPRYSRDYLDPAKRSIANAIQVFFRGGGQTDLVEVEYPLGHPRRRAEGLPLLQAKLAANLAARLPPGRCRQLLALFEDRPQLESVRIADLMKLLATRPARNPRPARSPRRARLLRQTPKPLKPAARAGRPTDR